MTDSPILIDLDNLTREMVEEALPHMRECRYDAPCIIGAMIPPEQRATVGYGNVAYHVRSAKIAFPSPEQFNEAFDLQVTFDCGNPVEFYAQPRIAELLA